MTPYRLPNLAAARVRLGVVVYALAWTALGCSYGISVRAAKGPQLLDAWRASISEADDLSLRTRQTLRQWDIDRLFDQSPAQAYTRLQALALHRDDRDLLFALAETSYLLGRRNEKKGAPECYVHYYSCAGYAYHYLFAGDARDVNPFDPRFRLACDLYNAGLAKCIRVAQRAGRLDPGRQLLLPTPDGKGFLLSIDHHGFPWPPADFGPLLFSADYEVVGLANQYRGYGLGVALIGTRSPAASAQRAPGQAFYFPGDSFPVTAFMRFDCSLADLTARRAGKLELYNPLETQTVAVRDLSVALETDLTTPLAYALSRTSLEGIEYKAFLRADQVRDRTGIYMFEPYQPGKIPVLMVHGLLSSPLTWTTMFNDLRADPQLREHFQFWFYLYPTGDTYLANAADLRERLTRLRAGLDPEHRDAAFDRMVLVGHSMGGLVSKLMTVSSGNDFWALATNQPFESLKLDPRTRAELQRLFFFEPVPEVRRVIFIATPHHGSKLGPSPPARLVAQFIQMPKNLIQTAHEAAVEDPQVWIGKTLAPTSLDMLAPKAPALELLSRRAPLPQVRYHSIIGDLFGSGRESTDGVVPYTSSHVDNADSEIIVAASHMAVQHQPRAVLEVRRILLEHLEEMRGAGSPTRVALQP